MEDLDPRTFLREMDRESFLQDMDRRTFLFLGLGTAGSLLFLGCGPAVSSNSPTADNSPGPRPTLRLPALGGFGFPSPFTYNAGPGYAPMILIYDTLLIEDSTGRFVPWLAKSFTKSSDGLTYTFSLRDNVRWHDGTPFSAADVAFTFDYFNNQSLPPLVIAQPQNVASVKATGPLSVVFTLDKPAVTFISAVAGFVPIVPQHIWSPIADATTASDKKLLVGTGPYIIQTVDPDNGGNTFVANDNFFLGKPFAKAIQYRPEDNPLNGLKAGDVDVAETNPNGVRDDVLGAFRSDSSLGETSAPSTFCFPLYWNIAQGGTLADVRFRQACAKAINRGDIVNRLVGTNGQPGNPGFLPKTNPFHVDVEQYAYDQAGANQLLDAMGLTRGTDGMRKASDGTPLSFSLITSAPPASHVPLVVNALKAVGITLNVQAADPPTIFGRFRQGAFDMALTAFPGPTGQYLGGDPDYLRTIYSAVPQNQGFASAHGYSNPQMEGLLQQQLVAQDPAARKQIVAQIQQIAAKDLPVLPLYYTTLFEFYKKSVFDQWYYLPGSATGQPKQAMVTGRRAGITIRPTK